MHVLHFPSYSRVFTYINVYGPELKPRKIPAHALKAYVLLGILCFTLYFYVSFN
jgi:hypothetical protein